MTPKKTPTTRAKHPWTSFRDNGRGHLADAEAKLALLSQNSNAKGIAADAVLAAIAYADAITVQRTGLHNTSDHSALADLLVQALGAAADSGQVTRLRRIIERKNEGQYGGTFWSRQTAETYLEQVRRFTAWAIRVLGERGYGTEHVADIE